MTAARLHLIIGTLFGAAGVALLAAGAHSVGGQATVAGQMLLFAADLGLRAFAGTRMFVLAAPLGGGMTIAGWLALTLAAMVHRSQL